MPFNLLKNTLRIFVVSCTFIVSQPNFALEGGKTVTASDYPGLVILSYASIPNTFVTFNNCSGIVLSARKILTSASCLFTIRTNPFGSVKIPANKVFVHPVSNGEIGGNSLSPPVTTSTTPRAKVSSYVIHPQNPFRGGHHNLAVLTLSANINMAPAYLYSGNNKFNGNRTTALGWEREQRTFPSSPFSFNYYVLRQLSFTLRDGNTNIDGLCYDNFTYTGTVFCGGFRNGVNFLDTQDEGAPSYRTVNGKKTVIGLLYDASHGFLFEGQYQYERYARISSMINFIKQHAPNTQFWNENSVQTEPEVSESIIPLLQLLLLDE